LVEIFLYCLLPYATIDCLLLQNLIIGFKKRAVKVGGELKKVGKHWHRRHFKLSVITHAKEGSLFLPQ